MAGRESFFWHKLHSLTGVIPTGFYLLQHLTLHSFSLAGAEKFAGILNFFGAMPQHILFGLKGVIWGCLIFHAVYGLFIISRNGDNYSQTALKYRENAYYRWQRWSGIFAFFFLAYHMATTSVVGQIHGHEAIQYSTWADRLAAPAGTYLMLVFYILGVVASAYHFAYGMWNFAIRWGITINERAQMAMAKFSKGLFVVVSAIGILALVGFFKPVLAKEHASAINPSSNSNSVESVPISAENR